MAEPIVVRFHRAFTGMTSFASPLTVRVELTEGHESADYGSQGKRLAGLLVDALPGQTLIALSDALAQRVSEYRNV